MKRFAAVVAAVVAAALACCTIAHGASSYPAPTEGDYTIRNFKFANGETLPELHMHYRTLGTIHKNHEHVDNAVLVMHGTGGDGTQFLRDIFGGELFGAGQPLDASKYFIILIDDIGHGKSSKPSDGLRAKFPHYAYADMILAEHDVIAKKLAVDHLRLVMGTSMGGMHTWLWGETYPDFMDALMPLASLPVQISGRNRMMRKMMIDSIRTDPEWKNGNYTQPPHGLVGALDILLIMGSSPLQWQKEAPTRDTADKFLDDRIARYMKEDDANDLLYQIDSSRDYDPQSKLSAIKAPLLAVNSADDQINPPELGILEREMKNVPHGRAFIIPISDATHGHGTHTWAAVWKDQLVQLMSETDRKK
ncbi:MAG TPA: alpha/beta fold hydrolase [Rudaea sp.]|jgi:homoserine O-acetyltransferase|nr:alpha/beta fold hydrolase [Rudaea sp.]